MAENSPKFEDVMSSWMRDNLSQIRVMIPGKVERFDSDRCCADVIPLIRSKTGKSWPVLADCPVQFPIGGGYFMRVPIERGDIVNVIFPQQDPRNAAKGIEDDSNEMLFSAGSAVIVPGFKPASKSIDAFEDDGLLIGHEDSDSYIQIESDKMTMKFGTTDIIFSSTGMKVVVAGVEYDFLTHTHTSAAPGVPTGPVITTGGGP